MNQWCFNDYVCYVIEDELVCVQSFIYNIFKKHLFLKDCTQI